ncbi:MAG: hypothetical protein WAV28_17225 [Sedimentisphaerales bacterium]
MSKIPISKEYIGSSRFNTLSSAPLLFVFDDPFLGLHKDTDVGLRYADGFQEQRQTDSEGKLTVLKSHGKYIDTDISSELGSINRRIFIFPPDPSSETGAWQRLVNLGYVLDKEPPESPPDPESLALCLDDFQADHNLEPTGELDEPTFKKIAAAYDDVTIWEERNWEELENSEDLSSDYKLRDPIT